MMSLEKFTREICLGMNEIVRRAILDGGSGTRLSQMSRAGFAKPFLCLTVVESSLKEALTRWCFAQY